MTGALGNLSPRRSPDGGTGETFLEKFVKGTREVTRKSQQQKQQESFGKQRVKWSAPRNGRRKKDYSGPETRSMFPGTWTCEGKQSHCAMIQRLPNTLDAGKHWSQSLEITGGLKCLGTLDSMLAPVTSASGRNRRGRLWQANCTLSESWTHNGTHLAWISQWNSPPPLDMTCKGDRSGRLQEIPQLIIIYEIWLQPTSRRFLRELDEAPRGNNLHYILQCLCVPASVTRV